MSRLGYIRYGAHGGDTGSVVSPLLGRIDPDHVLGVHIVGGLAFPAAQPGDFDNLSALDQAKLTAAEHLREVGTGYAELQSTKPQTISYALSDSPVGQLAWIAEKFQEWTDPAKPLPKDAVDLDHLLTDVSIYWFTNTSASSANLYYENRHSPHVGADRRDYLSVMEGLRNGRMWVDHGALVKAVEMEVREVGNQYGEPLGGALLVRRGRPVELVVRITAQHLPNWANFVPSLNRVDVIRGAVGGAVTDRDTFKAPDTKVVRQWDTSGKRGTFELVLPLGQAEEPFYVRVRGTDGNRSQPGYLGAAIDPQGPQLDVVGAADPWTDLWFYTNPIWVLPKR